MKRKILIFFVIFTLLFSSFSIFSYAEDTSDKVLEEYKQNYPNVDLSTLSGSTKSRVVGAVEDIIDEKSLYLYVYEKYPTYISGYIEKFSYSFTDFRGAVKSDIINKRSFTFVDHSTSGNISKYRVNLSDLTNLLDNYNHKHSYSFEKMHFGSSLQGFNIYQNCSYEFDYNDPEKIKITYEQSEVATLDVHHTFYRTTQFTDENFCDEVNTVYFSVPEEYTKYYKKLYSVASTYTKKKTTPIFVTTNSMFSDPHMLREVCLNSYEDYFRGFISKDYTVSERRLPGVASTLLGYDYYAKVGFNLKSVPLKYYHIDNLYNEPPQYFFSVDPNSLSVTDDVLLEYIDSCESQGLNLKLFESSEFVPYSEKTIDSSFNSTAYIHLSEFLDKSNPGYEILVLTMLSLFKDNPEKIKEILEKTGIIYQELENEPFLILCDEKFRNEISVMSDIDVSNKFLININDVSAFRNFLKNNTNVVLYRYDVASYFSEEVSIISNDSSGFDVIDDGSVNFIVQQYLYEDFRTIDLTFNDGDSFVSACVNSHPQDFTGDTELKEEIPPENTVPDDFNDSGLFPDFKDFWRDFIDGKISDFFKLIIRITVVLIGVTFLVIGTKLFIEFVGEKNKNKKE